MIYKCKAVNFEVAWQSEPLSYSCSKAWQVYEYTTEKFTFCRTYQLLNQYRSVPLIAAPQIANREMSARTRRAKKMHDAHLRSMGLGPFTPSNGSHVNTDNKRDSVNWKQDVDDDF